MITQGKPIVFGIQEPKPLVGFPEGKVRIRMRPCKCVAVYVRTNDGIQEFRVEPKDGNWVAFGPAGRNVRVER